MTIAFWCVLVAIVLPLLFTGYAKFSGAGGYDNNARGYDNNAGGYDNNDPRQFLQQLDGIRKRAHHVQQNSYESTPAFAAGVIIAHLIGGDQVWVDGLALVYVVLRLVYGLCYLADWATARSVVWALALACIVGLFFT